MKNIYLITACFISFLSVFAGCKEDEKETANDEPKFLSANLPENNKISPTTNTISLIFDRKIIVSDSKKITLNGNTVSKSSVSADKTLNITVELEQEKSYTLIVEKGAVTAVPGSSNQNDITIHFSTTAADIPVVVSSSIKNNDEITPLTPEIYFDFDMEIKIADVAKITLNGSAVADVSANEKRLTISLNALEENKEYSILIASGAVKSLLGGENEDYSISFFIKSIADLYPMVVGNPTSQARNVYDFLIKNYGQKIISGAQANVAWNTNEAEWVKHHTGKYPAINCFDYIHVYANWTNYSDTRIVEEWWESNGLVSLMWHWSVPSGKGDGNYGFYTADTSFDITKALQEGTPENGTIKADLEKVANYLLALKNKNIPVIWRPLHEAAGGWFWWGAKDAASYKALWKMMFETFQAKGLNNLIWVWTSELTDDSWYPGDEYVDIIGRDIYNVSAATDIRAQYGQLSSKYAGKLVALTEMGNIAKVTDQWNNNAKWSWFIPWYDYDRTKYTVGNAFEQTSHQHANIDFWKNAFASPNVVSRDMMPSLK